MREGRGSTRERVIERTRAQLKSQFETEMNRFVSLQFVIV